MKRILTIILAVAMLPSISVLAQTLTDKGFAYEVTNGEATIVYQSGATYEKNLVIPETLGGYPVTTIGESAFWGSAEIDTVVLPPSVKRIEGDAFYDAIIGEINLENVEYLGPESLEDIRMEELHFPEGCYIDKPVNYAPNLKKITVGDGAVITRGTFEDETTSDRNGIPIDIFTTITDIEIGNNVTIEDQCFRCLDELERVSIGDGTTIGQHCFAVSNNLENLVLGKVASIGTGAFRAALSLKEVTIPGTVQEIGDNAFSYISSLEKVVIEEGVTTIGTNAFRNSEALAELYLPKSLTLAGDKAFYQKIEPTYFVFYGGRKTDWDAIDKTTTSLTDVEDRDAILYNYLPIDPTYIPKYVNEVTIMGKGTAYGRFFLKNVNNTVAKNRTVRYSIDGYEQGKLVTDENGDVVVAIDGIASGGEYEIEFTGTGIQTTQGVLKVTVEPITFKSSYEAVITSGANVGLAFGVGGSVGKLEAEAKLAEVGIEGSLETGFSLEQEYKDGKNALTLLTKRNLDVATEAELGLFAGVDFIGASGVESSFGSINGGVSTGWSGGVGYKDEDFNPDDEKDVENVARFVGAALLEGVGNSITAMYIADKINAPVNITQKGTSVTLEAGASLGVFETSVNGSTTSEASIASGGGKLLSENSTETLSDNSKKYSTSSATETGISFANFDFKAKEDIASLSAGLDVWNNKAKNKLAFSAEEGSSGNLGKVSVTTEITEDNSFLIGKNVTVSKHTISYEDSAAREVVKNYSPLEMFASGERGHFGKLEAEKSASAMIYSDETGEYTVSKEKQRGVELDLSGKLSFAVTLGGKLGLSGIESYEFEEYNGVYEKNAAFIQAHNDIEAEVADKFVTVGEALAVAYNKISEIVAEYWDEACQWIDDNVIEQGKAKIKKTKESVTDWYVSITTPEEAETYSLLAIDGETSVASYVETDTVTIGKPYVVTVTDKEGNVVEDLSENPLEMTISYDSAEIDGLDHPNVLWWDGNRGAYIKKDAVIDTENCTASFNITEGGQYLLAVDNGYPEIIDYDDYMEDGKPVLKAMIKDFSGIDRIILKVGGEEVVNKDNFTDYYNPVTCQFIYPVYEKMEQGGSVNTQIIVYDNYNNESWERAYADWEVLELEDITTTALDRFTKGRPVQEIMFKDAEWANLNVYLCCEVTDIYGNVYKKAIKAEEEEIDYNETGLSYDYRKFVAQLPKIENGCKVKVWYEMYSDGNCVKAPAGETVVLDKTETPLVYISKIDEDKVSVRSLSEGTENATDVIIAVYDEMNRIVKMDRKDFAETVTFENIPENMQIKVLLWNEMRPVCESAIIKTPDNLY